MLIIGIAGGTGSGKTTVVNKIVRNFPTDSVSVISQDSYYKDNSELPIEERQKINFDHPGAIEFDLLIEHINELKKGNSIKQPKYSYLTCTRSENTIITKSTQVIIVEGILILTNKKLRDILDMKIFVYADADDRLLRVIKRDITDRGRTVETILERYLKTVKPMHEQFIEPSKKFADLIVPEGGSNKVAIEFLISIIDKHLRNL